MKRSLSKLFVFIFLLNFSSLAVANNYENHQTFLLLVVFRLLHIPPQTQITLQASSALRTSTEGELLDLNDLLNRLLKGEETDDNEEIEIRNDLGDNFSLPVNDQIFRYLPHEGRGIAGRYLIREENGSRRHIFDLVNDEIFTALLNTYLDVKSLRPRPSNFEILFANPSYFVPDSHFHSLEDLPNHEDIQIFCLEGDGIQISGSYSRRYEYDFSSLSSVPLSSMRENFDEVIEFERIAISNSDENLRSSALILHPKFVGSDPNAAAFRIPSCLSLQNLAFRNRYVIFYRYNNLEHIFEIIKSYHAIAPIHYLELGFHGSEYSFDMKYRVEERLEDGSLGVIERKSISIQNSDANIVNFIGESIRPYLDSQTKIVLNACLTGALHVDNNFVDVFSRLFPENEISGPICDISVEREGSDVLDVGSWSYELFGVGYVPISYRRLYRTTADLRDFRVHIEQMFFEHLMSLRANFVFFHREQGLVTFERLMIHSLIESLTLNSEFYTKRILNVFVGRIFSDAYHQIHVINPEQDLIVFLTRNAIKVHELHQIDSEDFPITEGVMDVELRDGFLTRIKDDVEELPTESDEASDSNRKRKRNENEDSDSSKRQRTQPES